MASKPGDDESPGSPVPSYADEQAEVRKEAVQDILDTTRAVEHPTAVFTGGQPGAGKSESIVRPLQADYADKGRIGVIDPDQIRPLFSRAQQDIASAKPFSPEAYNAAGTVAYEISLDVSKHQRNILRDGTLADLKYPQQEMAQLRRQDYRIEAHVAAVYQDLSYARTVMRTEQDVQRSPVGFGRTVDREFHDKAVAGVAASTGVMWNQQMVDRLVLYDARGARVFDGKREGDQWVDTAGRPHAGISPKEQLEQRQHKPEARDLVDAASTWLAARTLIQSPDRKVPASDAAITAVSRETMQSFDKVLASRAASQLARSDKPLRAALVSHRDRPLQAAAEAWRRNPAEAVKQWPEHKAAFALAERTVQACAAAKPAAGQAARDHMADKLARGQVKPEPDKSRAPERTAPGRTRKPDDRER